MRYLSDNAVDGKPGKSSANRAHAVVRLLNARRFADETRGWTSQRVCESVVYEWRSKCRFGWERIANADARPSARSDHQMLRIEKDCDECATRLLLSGRIQSDHIACLQSAMSDSGTRRILDLSEVTLVDLEVVRFLISCEDGGIELVQCPPYVREWILRERVDGVQPGPSDGG